MNGFSLNTMEADLIIKMQEFTRTSWLDKIMTGFTGLGDAGAMAIATCGGLLLSKKYRMVGIYATVALLVDAISVNLILKPLVQRRRPFLVNETIEVLTKTPKDYSFPSGHTGACVTVAAMIMFCMDRKYGVTASIAALFMAFSRVYAGVHYPTDVMASILIGVMIAMLSVSVMKRFEKRNLNDGTATVKGNKA